LGRMRKRAYIFGLVALVLSALPASSIAIERDRSDRSFETSARWSRDKARTTAAADDSKAVAKLIRDINVAAQKDKRRMLSIIVINTNVAATTLEQQKARTGLSLGDVYVAHALSLATRKKFDTIVALKAAGQSWSQIARAHKVSLKGSTELLKEMMKNS
jgi:PIN domain nuclease of toxin-antitoxin system